MNHIEFVPARASHVFERVSQHELISHIMRLRLMVYTHYIESRHLIAASRAARATIEIE